MKRFSLIIVMSLLMFPATNAQVVQVLNLKNGSTLNGYVKTQKPGNNCVFASENAVIVMEGKLVKEIKTEKVPYGKLSDEWKQWAEENEVLHGVGEGREMTFSTIVDKIGNRISNVYLIEKGEFVKYVEFTKHDYTLKSDEIASIEYAKRPNTMLSGVNRSLLVKSGDESRTVSGQCLKEIPGKTIYLLGEDGVMESFNVADVKKDNSIKNNPDQSIFAQSPLLDEILLKDGSIHCGIVTERNYQNIQNLYYILTSINNGSEFTTSIQLSEVTEFHKLPNPDYNPIHDILLKPGDMVFNRKECKTIKLEELEDVFFIDSKSEMMSFNVKGKFCLDVEANFKENKELQEWLLIKARKIEKTKKQTEHFEFDYADIVKYTIQPKDISTSMNNTTKISYSLNEKGLYVFFNKQTKQAVLIELK